MATTAESVLPKTGEPVAASTIAKISTGLSFLASVSGDMDPKTALKFWMMMDPMSNQALRHFLTTLSPDEQIGVLKFVRAVMSFNAEIVNT